MPEDAWNFIQSQCTPKIGSELSTFEIDLKRDGTVVDHTCAVNVLGGPVAALRSNRHGRTRSGQSPLAAGEIVTTER